MENIRCCVLDKKSVYRGIDREVDMRIFNTEKNDAAYEYVFNQYLRYLSTEGTNTPENLDVVLSFSDLINQYYGNSEIILYTTYPIENKTSYCFLGIDIIDTHLESVIKKGKPVKDKLCLTNQYDLYCNHADADAVIRRMQEKDTKYSDLYYVYVYRYKTQTHQKYS
jgi:hypothetical protein